MNSTSMEGRWKGRVAALFLFISCIFSAASSQEGMEQMNKEIIQLPEPGYTGTVSVEEAINHRRSIRNYRNEDLSIADISQLLWACAGKTFDGVTRATRSYPSAGGLHPLEVFVVTKKMKELDAGIYRYDWKDHALIVLKKGDFRAQLSDAALGQSAVLDAPFSIVIAAVYKRTSRIYGQRGSVRYVHMDAGHAAQNVYLQAGAMGLGTVAIGAFFDERVKVVLGLEREDPLYIMPVGKPAE